MIYFEVMCKNVHNVTHRATVCMVTTLSVGEAFWSPRTYDYTMSIAPLGKEASFSALVLCNCIV